MNEKFKYSLITNFSDNSSVWTRNEKRIWFFALLLGTCMLYSTRTSMPLLIPVIASESKWSKKDSGTILSSFFWGYTLTQVLGGYFSDKFGGHKVILFAAIGWSTITILMPNVIYLTSKFEKYSLHFVVLVRILNGALQGVHFPSMISITSQNLSSNERTSFFGLLTSGSALGTLLTGTLGSFILDYWGWPIVFQIIGLMGLLWALGLRSFVKSKDKTKVINISLPNRLSLIPCTQISAIPWLRLVSKSSFWACVLTHACEMNCFFVLISWLPTYFHENFPSTKGWIVNMIPWIALPPCTVLAKMLTGHLIAKEWTITTVRKWIQSICFLSQNIALFIISGTSNFSIALTCVTVIIGGTGFHNNAVTVNPQDLAPAYSGSVFGLMNTVGAIPGFLGVYLVGHILDVTQSWPMVFSTSALVNFIGWAIFSVFGSAEPIS